MSDIVERLRERRPRLDGTVWSTVAGPLCTEAAAEIIRLRAERRTLRGDLESTCAIEERLTDELHSFSKEAAATIVTLHARIETLEAALRPFAEAGNPRRSPKPIFMAPEVWEAAAAALVD